ncbi:unnamed protein product, partial [Porites evermanni]
MSARGGKRYGSGRRLLSPGSFVKSIEKRSDSRSSWLKSHGRIYVRRDILDTFKKLKAQCVFSTDTAFLQHLLSFEMRRQQSLKAKQAMKKSTEESSAVQQPLADDSNLHTSTPVKRGKYDGSVGSAKGMEKVALWSDHIVRHFWHCCSLASEVEGNELEALKILKDTWISLLHHVCNQHEWADGHCDHKPITEENHQLPWFDRRSKEFEALQKIILDPDLLESFKYYTRFRHTGALERANSLSLMYASKRISYILQTRKQLAAIDWNYHLDIPEQEDVLGEVAVTQKYNQRTKSWNVKIVKQAKDYGYIWMLLAKVFHLRVEDNENMQRAVPMEADDPRRIAPSIAVVPPPPSREL